jgi:hypothetical protein
MPLQNMLPALLGQINLVSVAIPDSPARHDQPSAEASIGKVGVIGFIIGRASGKDKCCCTPNPCLGTGGASNILHVANIAIWLWRFATDLPLRHVTSVRVDITRTIFGGLFLIRWSTLQGLIQEPKPIKLWQRWSLYEYQ